jgi:excisionase family DNA binding protein
MKYLRRRQAAQYLGISERTLSKWMKRNVVPFTRMSRRIVLFEPEQLDEAVAQHGCASTAKRARRREHGRKDIRR